MSLKIKSTSPVSGEVLWEGPASTADETSAAIDRASNAYKQWRLTPIERRLEIVRAYAKHLQEHRAEIANLISNEVGKLPWDANGEVGAAIAKAEVSIEALQQRRSEQLLDPVSKPTGSIQRVIRYHPIGVALVLGPFNFPLHLPGGQIIPALLSGNTVVFKPSEQAAAVGQWMASAWKAAGLPDGVLEIIQGGVQTAVDAIEAPQIAGVFLTGSRSAGRAIHRQLAGRPEVLLALELGGNNPIVVTEPIPSEIAATIVSFSAFISAGQRCTCARRAFFVGDEAKESIQTLIDRTNQLCVGVPGDSQGAKDLSHAEQSVQIGPVISDSAAAGLRKTYEKLIQLGCQPLVPFHVDQDKANLVHPCILDSTDLAAGELAELGEMEWFGPMLVIHRVASFEEALRLASGTAYGLAASLLGGTKEMFDQFVTHVGAGVVNWNGPTTGAAGTLPFGGLRDSGNHRPAGFFAIDFCSDPVASLQRQEIAKDDPWDITK